MNRRAVFFIAQTDENGVDPRPNPHDTAHMGRALHGSGGAAPVVATKQTGPAPHRSQRPECTPAALRVRSAEPPPASPPKQESRRPPAVDKQPAAARLLAVAAAGYLPTAAPSPTPPCKPRSYSVTMPDVAEITI